MSSQKATQTQTAFRVVITGSHFPSLQQNGQIVPSAPGGGSRVLNSASPFSSLIITLTSNS